MKAILQRAAPVLLGLAFVLQAGWALRQDASVGDEHPHILAGYLHWKSGHTAGGLGNPPLGQLWIALPLHLSGRTYAFPEDAFLAVGAPSRVGRVLSAGVDRVAMGVCLGRPAHRFAGAIGARARAESRGARAFGDARFPRRRGMVVGALVVAVGGGGAGAMAPAGDGVCSCDRRRRADQIHRDVRVAGTRARRRRRRSSGRRLAPRRRRLGARGGGDRSLVLGSLPLRSEWLRRRAARKMDPPCGGPLRVPGWPAIRIRLPGLLPRGIGSQDTSSRSWGSHSGAHGVRRARIVFSCSFLRPCSWWYSPGDG